MGGTNSNLQKAGSLSLPDSDASTHFVPRTLDGRSRLLKLKKDTIKVKWKEDLPNIYILQHSMRLQDKQNNVIELMGDQERVEIGGFQMVISCAEESEQAKAYSIGINTKLLNLATFEIEVESSGNIILSGRKLSNSSDGQLKLITLPEVRPNDIQVEALDNNRTIWIRICNASGRSNSQSRNLDNDQCCKPVDSSHENVNEASK